MAQRFAYGAMYVALIVVLAFMSCDVHRQLSGG